MGAVAADDDYDVASRKKLLAVLSSSPVVGALQSAKILEVMAGYGRNVKVLKMFDPRSITIVDILQDHIAMAAK